MLKPVTAEQILDGWARKPLDFAPGTKWQYSNTNYVVAGRIVEKASGMTVMEFLQARIFTPLGMHRVRDMDQIHPGQHAATGYLRYGLGPLRPAPKEGAGWLFAAGELSMTAEDLAKWDIAIMDQKLLKAASYQEMEREVVLKNGVGTRYGLGVFVGSQSGRRVLEHGGEVSGFTAENTVFPDDRAAIVVLTNEDASEAAGKIAGEVTPLLFPGAQDATQTMQARKIFEDLQQGKIDRSLFTDDANSYFSEQALADFAAGLGPLGAPQEFTQSGQALRGGMTYRRYTAKFANRTLIVWTYELTDGKIEDYQIAPAE
jgi:CubicO group peptidase (beta-lactamase class C family)